MVGDFAKCKLNERFILSRAKEDADRRLIARRHFVLFVIGDVCIELSEVLVGKGGGFQFNEYMALEYAVIEDEVDEKVLIADEDALLAGLEAETVAHFEQEVLEAVKKGVFEV